MNTLTNEGSVQYAHCLDNHVEFFSKAGSLFQKNRNSFYDNKEDIIPLFLNAWKDDKTVAFKLLCWLRDCRGGSGNRSGFRKCLKWIAKNEPEWIVMNIQLIPLYGRWDDLRTLFNTECEKIAVSLWIEALMDNNVLACKWAKRTDIPLYLRLKEQKEISNIGDFRRFLSSRRQAHLVETSMCNKQWDKIDYSKVPSVAMSRYTNAFNKHDWDGFSTYKDSLDKGEVTINAGALFPHDCVRTARYGDKMIANSQFNALPNYMDEDGSIMVLCDSSGSMQSDIGGSVTAMDVSMGLALYCSGKLSPENPFYRKFIQFESESRLTDWSNYKMSETIPGSPWGSTDIFNGAVGSTRIDKALDLMLNTGKMFKVLDENMPKMLLICSYMQFHEGIESSVTQVETCLTKWDDAGYSRPKIVYWNLCPYNGQPDRSTSENIALISGFSPSILKSVFECEDFSPINIMLKELEKYEIIIP